MPSSAGKSETAVRLLAMNAPPPRALSGHAGPASGDVLIDQLRAEAKSASDSQAAQLTALAQPIDRRRAQAEAGSNCAHGDQPLARTRIGAGVRAPPAHQIASQPIRFLPLGPDSGLVALESFPLVASRCQPLKRRGIRLAPVHDRGTPDGMRPRRVTGVRRRKPPAGCAWQRAGSMMSRPREAFQPVAVDG